jgi:hypothetical protein
MKMLKIKLASLLLLNLTLLSAPAGAAGICRTDTDTLLRVHASRGFIYRSIRLPPPPMHVDEEYLVTRGGFSLVIRTERELCCDQTVTRTVADGLAKPAQVAALTAALTAHHVGQQTSCVAENDLSGPGGVRVLGTYEVSWYAPDGSENSFQIVYADPGDSSLPPCGPDAAPFIDATVRTFADAFAAVPGHQVCKP